ncbi:MAG: hypothetical protein MUP49_00210, partial [Dehalococcoidia bacterium]|nr:hypothetical protein [Dehalococcoidia bacterium]
MLTENGLDIPVAKFQSRKVEEDAYREFELLTERPNFGNESAVLLKCPCAKLKRAMSMPPFNILSTTSGELLAG